MTKQELVNTYYKLDQNKHKLLQKGVAFELIICEDHNFLHTGIGTGMNMTEMTIYSLIDLFKNSNSKSIESFAESVKTSLIEAYNSNLFE